MIYFLYFAALGALSPFLVLYYQDLGLNARQIGLLAALFPIMMLIGAPLLGGLADATGKYKTMTLLVMVAALLGGLGIFFLKSYLALFLGIAIFSFFLAPIIPLSDSNVLALLGERKHAYGRQRVWGAVGWGLVAPLVGLLVERFGLSAAFYGYAVLMLACVIAMAGLPLARSGSSPQTRSFRPFLRADWLSFLTILLILGVGLGTTNSFVYLYLAELEASNIVLGLSLTFATISEIPITFFGYLLLQRFRPFALIYLSLAALILRLFLYSLVDTAIPILFIQLLHGITFSLAWIAAVNHADSIAPKGLSATAQGLISGMLMGLGSAAGGLFGGALYDAFGPALMFRIVAVSLLAGLIVFAAAEHLLKQPLFKQP